MVEFLLENGSSQGIRDKLGNTAGAIAAASAGSRGFVSVKPRVTRVLFFWAPNHFMAVLHIIAPSWSSVRSDCTILNNLYQVSQIIMGRESRAARYSVRRRTCDSLVRRRYHGGALQDIRKRGVRFLDSEKLEYRSCSKKMAGWHLAAWMVLVYEGETKSPGAGP